MKFSDIIKELVVRDKKEREVIVINDLPNYDRRVEYLPLDCKPVALMGKAPATGHNQGGLNRSSIHLEADREITWKRVTRNPGDLLCGYRPKGFNRIAEIGNPPVTCPKCLEVQSRLGLKNGSFIEVLN